MLPDAVAYLRCPHCGDDLASAERVLRCPRGHAFDVARQGYVSLLRGAATFTGDTAAMVEARTAFLGAGHYDPIARALAAVEPGPGCVVDLGAGTGHYLAAVLDARPGRVGLALDASKNALRRAARAHPRIGAVVCDAWQPLPVRTDAAGLVVNVFAPRNPAELHRVLAPGGTLVVVAPTAAHLGELVSALDLLSVGADKQDGIDDRLAAHFTPVDRRLVEFRMALPHRDVAALVGMGPNAFHDASALPGRIAALTEPVVVTGSVSVTSYSPG
ncbi:Ribosomal RNA large subunit methyltransferase A [Actinokineospora spheciospongiae]|uniref:Ribosomal RNA large subunit methyltransferase A n=1 Tax=Actinokineospora spheciospongiae TaxID=909613 RepID=W7ISL5_9PSEU|nr:methyltransferase domain-containing protein [Actinokineospora spheciospongiae]EWC59712.1 Ribosomal RNA large subunit methyltransferase A [Actinokineospora spheciospongiae]